jgi:hypothetical protein
VDSSNSNSSSIYDIPIIHVSTQPYNIIEQEKCECHVNLFLDDNSYRSEVIVYVKDKNN